MDSFVGTTGIIFLVCWNQNVTHNLGPLDVIVFNFLKNITAPLSVWTAGFHLFIGLPIGLARCNGNSNDHNACQGLQLHCYWPHVGPIEFDRQFNRQYVYGSFFTPLSFILLIAYWIAYFIVYWIAYWIKGAGLLGLKSLTASSLVDQLVRT